jgi:hypothetical protein
MEGKHPEARKNDGARTEHACSLLILMLLIVIVIDGAADGAPKD